MTGDLKIEVQGERGWGKGGRNARVLLDGGGGQPRGVAEPWATPRGEQVRQPLRASLSLRNRGHWNHDRLFESVVGCEQKPEAAEAGLRSSVGKP